MSRTKSDLMDFNGPYWTSIIYWENRLFVSLRYVKLVIYGIVSRISDGLSAVIVVFFVDNNNNVTTVIVTVPDVIGLSHDLL